MYHIHLDLRWLLITLISVKNDQWEDPNETNEEMNNCLHNITGDLIYISMKIFESVSFSFLFVINKFSFLVEHCFVKFQIQFTDIQ